ncbi:MAG: hypothetical protein VYE73_12830 [Acidobacteriota bacterium]|nr:hypothetical protein [Acidobacteriota bacterium]
MPIEQFASGLVVLSDLAELLFDQVDRCLSPVAGLEGLEAFEGPIEVTRLDLLFDLDRLYSNPSAPLSKLLR